MLSSVSSLNELFGDDGASTSDTGSRNRSDNSINVITPQASTILKKQPSSSITEEDLARISKQYSIVLPLRTLLGCLWKMPPAGWATISETLLRCGLAILPHSFLVSVVDYYDVAPLQLTANSYLIIIGLFITFMENNLGELNIDEFTFLYKLKKGQDDTFYLSKMGRKNFKGLTRISSKIKDWDSEFFLFPCGNDVTFREDASNRDYQPPRNFNTARLTHFSHLTDEQRDMTQLVTLSNLVLYWFCTKSAYFTVAYISLPRKMKGMKITKRPTNYEPKTASKQGETSARVIKIDPKPKIATPTEGSYGQRGGRNKKT